MKRFVPIVSLLSLALAGCTWPPRPSVPPVGPAADQAAQEATDALPRTTTPDAELPRVSPPAVSVPRTGRGGLL